jgi:hypothetical protein
MCDIRELLGLRLIRRVSPGFVANLEAIDAFEPLARPRRSDRQPLRITQSVVAYRPNNPDPCPPNNLPCSIGDCNWNSFRCPLSNADDGTANASGEAHLEVDPFSVVRIHAGDDQECVGRPHLLTELVFQTAH